MPHNTKVNCQSERSMEFHTTGFCGRKFSAKDEKSWRMIVRLHSKKCQQCRGKDLTDVDEVRYAIVVE